MTRLLSKLLLLLTLLSPLTAFATTYATWNPSDKNANLTLSGGNLTATHDGGNPGVFESLRSTQCKSSGKWYWELTFGVQPRMSGVANSSASLTNYIGSDANGWGYYGGDGQKYNNGTGSAYGTTFTTSDVIGVALDMDGGTLTFYKNNVSQGTAFTGLTGTICAAASTDTSNATVTANFGATAQTYSPPAGYCAGLADVCPGGATATPTSIIGLVRALWLW